MQPMAGTRPAQAEAADTQNWAGLDPTSGTTCRAPDRGPRASRAWSPANARPHITTGLRVECFGVWVGVMCLYRPRGTNAESGPRLFGLLLHEGDPDWREAMFAYVEYLARR